MTKNNMVKEVTLSQIKEDLASGLTKWKKDDIGFGSLEKKYQLTLDEMVRLTSHPKVLLMETRIPTFIINDDLADDITVPSTGEDMLPSTIVQLEQPRVKILESNPIETSIITTQVVVREEPKKLKTLDTFI